MGKAEEAPGLTSEHWTLPRANTLAYYEHSLITDIKSFIALAPELPSSVQSTLKDNRTKIYFAARNVKYLELSFNALFLKTPPGANGGCCIGGEVLYQLLYRRYPCLDYCILTDTDTPTLGKLPLSQSDIRSYLGV